MIDTYDRAWIDEEIISDLAKLTQGFDDEPPRLPDDEEDEDESEGEEDGPDDEEEDGLDDGDGEEEASPPVP